MIALEKTLSQLHGQALDDYVADFGIRRFPPHKSTYWYRILGELYSISEPLIESDERLRKRLLMRTSL
jgi:hypothetical protein